MRLLSLLIALVALGGSLLGAAEPLKVGDTAPSIEAKDQDGKAWKLTELAGKQAVILYFYPKDDTPGCTKEACGFRDRVGELSKLGIAVLGVSRDDAESHRKFQEKHHLNFPLLADVDGKITDAFGASAADKPRARRVSFLISKEGKIVHVTDNRDAQVHLDELKAAVATLK